MKLRIFFTALIVSFFLFSYASAFTISPLRFLITLDPGNEQTVAIDIKNTNDQSIIVRPVVLGAEQNADGQTKFSAGVSPAEKWTRFKTGNVAVTPGGRKSIDFTVSAPMGSAPGSYYLAVGAQQVSGGGQIGLSGRLLTILVVQISGAAREKISIAKWSLAKYFTTDNIWPARLELKNEGNVEAPMEAQAILRDWRGNELQVFSLLDKTQFLSASERFVDRNINVGRKPFWPGIYQVQAQVRYGLTDQTVTAIDYLFYMPIWSVVALAIIILCIIGAFTSRHKFAM